jgi:hypothetical protein
MVCGWLVAHPTPPYIQYFGARPIFDSSRYTRRPLRRRTFTYVTRHVTTMGGVTTQGKMWNPASHVEIRRVCMYRHGCVCSHFYTQSIRFMKHRGLMRQIKRFLLVTTLTDDVMARTIEKYEENVTSRRCGRATLTECDPLPPEARGLNASTAGPHQTYNSWRARSWFEHAKQAKVGGQSAGPKACLAFLAERKQQRMLSGRPERPPFKRFVSLCGPHQRDKIIDRRHL